MEIAARLARNVASSLPRRPHTITENFEQKVSADERRHGVAGLSLPRLSRHPFHGAPKRNPSGIPVAMVFDHGAVVSSGFPSSDAGWGPAAPADVRSKPYHTVSEEASGGWVLPHCFSLSVGGRGLKEAGTQS